MGHQRLSRRVAQNNYTGSHVCQIPDQVAPRATSSVKCTNPDSQSVRLRTSNQGIFDRADDVYVDVERKFAEALVRD